MIRMISPCINIWRIHWKSYLFSIINSYQNPIAGNKTNNGSSSWDSFLSSNTTCTQQLYLIGNLFLVSFRLLLSDFGGWTEHCATTTSPAKNSSSWQIYYSHEDLKTDLYEYPVHIFTFHKRKKIISAPVLHMFVMIF